MTVVKCPCLNCSYCIEVETGYFHYSLDTAIEKMVQHLKERHTYGDIFEWLGRCVVQYFYKEMQI